jgi:four helix bundle protein
MRDHTKLKAFQLADELAVLIYRGTRGFPREEQFGLTPQLRRAAVSVASNIVEGCARSTEADYLHFLDIAFGSLREIEYQLSLAHRLGYVQPADFEPIQAHCVATSKVLAALIRSLRAPRPTAKRSTA